MLLEDEFIGVFPLDKIPNKLINGAYVVNTHTSELKGEHWLAIYVKQTKIDVFDPFGFYYPSILVNHVTKAGKPVYFSKRKCQNMLTNNCGPLCLLWLYINSF